MMFKNQIFVLKFQATESKDMLYLVSGTCSTVHLGHYIIAIDYKIQYCKILTVLVQFVD